MTNTQTETDTSSDPDELQARKIVLFGPAFTELREQAAWLRYRAIHAHGEMQRAAESERAGWKLISKLFGHMASHLEKMAEIAG